MPLSTDNDGKYMTRKWNEDRAKALVYPSHFTAVELAWLEVTATTDTGAFNPDLYMIETHPDDSRTESTKYDIRKRPEVGD